MQTPLRISTSNQHPKSSLTGSSTQAREEAGGGEEGEGAPKQAMPASPLV